MEYTILTIFMMVVLLAIMVGAILVYFVPTIIALYGKSKNTIWIFLINLILGLTTFGWFVALLWALYEVGAFDTFKRSS